VLHAPSRSDAPPRPPAVTTKPSIQALRQSSALPNLTMAAVAVAVGAAVAYSPPLALAILVVAGIVTAALLSPRWLLYGIVFLGPLPIGATTGKQKSLFATFGGVDAEGLRLFAVVLLVSLLLIVIAARSQDAVRRRPIRVAYALAAAILGWAGLELLRSPDVNLGIRLWFKVAYVALVALLTAEMSWTKRERQQLATTALLAAGILFVVGLWAGTSAGLTAGRLNTFSVIHPTPFGLALAFYVALSYALDPSSRRLPVQLLLLAAALVTLERTVWVAVFLGMSTFYLLRSRSSFRWLVPPILAALTVTAVLTYKPFYDRFFYRPISTGQALSLSSLPLNTNGRDAAWRALLHRVDQQTFLYGRGMGAADDYFQNVLQGSLNGVVHNEYLRLLYDGGFPLAALILLAAGLLLVSVLRWQGDVVLRAALAGMIVAYLFAALIDNAVDYYGYVGTGLAVLAGMYLSLRARAQVEAVEAQ